MLVLHHSQLLFLRDLRAFLARLGEHTPSSMNPAPETPTRARCAPTLVSPTQKVAVRKWTKSPLVVKSLGFGNGNCAMEAGLRDLLRDNAEIRKGKTES